jgi:hypothetical protein
LICVPQNIAQMTLYFQKLNTYTNRNYYNYAKTHIEPYFLNKRLYMSICCLTWKNVSRSAPPPLMVIFRLILNFFFLNAQKTAKELSNPLTLSNWAPVCFYFLQFPTHPVAPKVINTTQYNYLFLLQVQVHANKNIMWWIPFPFPLKNNTILFYV